MTPAAVIEKIKNKIDLSSRLAPAHKRLDAMEKRERYLVISAGFIVIITLLYAAIWEPVFSDLDNQQQRYQSQRQLLVWMKEKTQEIKTLQSAGAQSTARFNNQSVSSLVELSAQSMGIKPFIKKQTSDKKGVKIDIELASFNQIILWLNDMQNKYGIQTSNIKIEQQEKPGAVNVRVTLERDNS
jgi:general secretion pathway protein M